MKTLIVCYSFTRNNAALANYLQTQLHCDKLMLEEEKKRTGLTILLDLIFNRNPKLKAHRLQLQDYHNFIFVAPIWASKIASPLKTFLQQEKASIRRYSFITLCGGRAGQKQELIRQLSKLLGMKPVVVAELWVNDLLPADQKNTIKYTSGYRLKDRDLERFSSKLDDFMAATQGGIVHMES